MRAPPGWTGFAWAVAAVLAAAHVAVIASARSTFSDYTQDYLSARSLFRGASVYEPVSGGTVPGVPGYDRPLVNDHPPQYVVALAPVAVVRYEYAAVAVGLLNLLSAAVAAGLVARETGARPAPVVALTLLHPGVLACVWCGNVSLVLMLLVVGGWRALRRGADGWAGVLIAAAGVWKVYPTLLAVGLVAGRKWRAAAAAAGAGVLLLAGTIGLVGVDDLRRYFTERMSQNAAVYVGHGFNLSLPGLAHRLFGGPCRYSLWHTRVWESPALASGLAAAGSLGVLTAAAGGLWRRRSPDDLFAVLVPAMLLVCPLTWSHALPMLVIPVMILARQPGGGGRRATLVASTLALYLPERWVVEALIARFGEVNWAGGLILGTPTFGMLGVFALALTRPASPPHHLPPA